MRVVAVVGALACVAGGCVNWCVNGMHEGDRFEITLDDVWRSTDRFDWSGIGADDVPCGPVDNLRPGFRLRVTAEWAPAGSGGSNAAGECQGFAGTTATDVGLALRQQLTFASMSHVRGNALFLTAETSIGECYAGWAVGVLAQRPDAIGLPLVPLERPPILVQRTILMADSAPCPASCSTTWAATMQHI